MVPRFLIPLALLIATMALAAAPPPRPPTQPGRNLDAAAGWALFKRPWISDPSSLEGGGGIGPLYDARACNACHAGGGAGRVGELGDGMVVRVGNAWGEGDPIYGRQLQTHALPGFEPEGEVALAWFEDKGLRTPKLELTALHYGALADTTHTELRRAPSLFGIGLLEKVPEKEILSRKGKPAWIVSPDGTRRLGRFGWKAAVPEMETQIAIAFQRDFGISSQVFPGAYGECTQAETACRAVAGKDVELPEAFRAQIAGYLRLLHPPEAKDEKSAGFALFHKVGCLSCHAVLKGVGGAHVHAYTDLLLHDLGPGLDDGIAEGAAGPSEWRTAPLWDVTNNLAAGGLLHDGRARDIAEAVAWHGGEASRSRAAFNALSPKKRKLLERFLLGN